MASVQKVALVAGASVGSGREIALRLASDGLDVAINDLPSNKDELESLARDIQKIGRKAMIVPGDVSVEVDVQNIINTVVQDLGSLDVVRFRS